MPAGRRASRKRGALVTRIDRENIACWAALALIVGGMVAHALTYWVNVDDAFVSFRYAENLEQGWGLVFNEGERVEGYTNFLWVLLLALAKALQLDVPMAAQVLGLLLSVSTLVVLFLVGRSRSADRRWLALLPCGIVACSASVAMWSGGGLETTLFMLLVTTALALFDSDLAHQPARPLSGFVFGLAALTRPEAAGVCIAAAPLAVVAFPARSRTVVKAMAGFAVLFVPHMVFRLVYYGYPFPNTFYAKTSLSWSQIDNGIGYLGSFLLDHGAWTLPLLAGLFWGATSENRRRGALLLGVLAIAFAYVVSVGGDFYHYSRFCVPYLPWLVLLICEGGALIGLRMEQHWSRRRRGFAPLDALARSTPVLVPLCAAIAIILPSKLRPDSRHGEYYKNTMAEAGRLMKAYGEWLRDNYPPNTTIAIASIGRVPYYSRLPTIDMLGLTDAHIAHHGKAERHGLTGHLKYDAEYVLSRKPDLVLTEFLVNRDLFNPSGDVTTTTVVKLFDPRRWWPALLGVFALEEFRLNYVPRAAEVGSDRLAPFFERDGGLVALQASVSRDSKDPRAHFELGMRYRKHGLDDLAVEALRRSVALDPGKFSTQLNIGYIYFDAGRFDQALAEFQALKKRFPNRPHADYGIARALHELGRFQEAIQYWQRFLESAPDDNFAPQARIRLREAQMRATARRRH
jgi:hypothetical protein